MVLTQNMVYCGQLQYDKRWHLIMQVMSINNPNFGSANSMARIPLDIHIMKVTGMNSRMNTNVVSYFYD